MWYKHDVFAVLFTNCRFRKLCMKSHWNWSWTLKLLWFMLLDYSLRYVNVNVNQFWVCTLKNPLFAISGIDRQCCLVPQTLRERAEENLSTGNIQPKSKTFWSLHCPPGCYQGPAWSNMWLSNKTVSAFWFLALTGWLNWWLSSLAQ